MNVSKGKLQMCVEKAQTVDVKLEESDIICRRLKMFCLYCQSAEGAGQIRDKLTGQTS